MLLCLRRSEYNRHQQGSEPWEWEDGELDEQETRSYNQECPRTSEPYGRMVSHSRTSAELHHLSIPQMPAECLERGGMACERSFRDLLITSQAAGLWSPGDTTDLLRRRNGALGHLGLREADRC